MGQFEQLVSRFNWYGQEADRLSECLTGSALELFYSFPVQVRSNYKIVVDKLSSIYSDNSEPITKQFKLMNTVQLADESLSAYAEKLLRISNEAYPDNPQQAELSATEVFLAGCREKDIARAVKLTGVKTLQEALGQIRSLSQHDLVGSKLTQGQALQTGKHTSSYSLKKYDMDSSYEDRQRTYRRNKRRLRRQRHRRHTRSDSSSSSSSSQDSKYSGSPYRDSRYTNHSQRKSGRGSPSCYIRNEKYGDENKLVSEKANSQSFNHKNDNTKEQVTELRTMFKDLLQSIRSEIKQSRADINENKYALQSKPNHNGGGYSSRSASPSQNNTGNPNQDPVCFKCNKPGHFARQCPTLKTNMSDGF
jgi:hypothetical protein